MEINSDKIGKFLMSLTKQDYIFLQNCIDFRNSLATLIERHELSDDFICDKFNVKPSKLKHFIGGNYEYTLRDISTLNAIFIQLESDKLKECVPFQVPKQEQ